MNRSYGGADVVTVEDAPAPTLRPGEILVRVGAASVTTADWRFRTATFPIGFRLAGRLMAGLFRPRNPILGMDYAGVVEEVGPGVTRFAPGDRVLGATDPFRRGAHAELVATAAEGAVVHAPPALRDAEAAAIPFGACSALAFLRDVAQVRPGQRVLVIGASGGVGVWAVQLARHLGAHVTGACSARNVELVRSLGAHAVVDYATAPLGRAGDDFDLILDTVGATTFARCRAALGPRGIFISLDSGLREIAQAIVGRFASGRRVVFAVSGNTRESLEEILRLIEAGVVRPVVDRVYPMAQIAEAHRHVEGRHKRGSVIVAIDHGATTRPDRVAGRAHDSGAAAFHA